jgi:putative DNA primase/helicase
VKYDTAALRADNPLETIAGRSVRLARDGKDFKGLCPFHAEKTPSFTINSAKRFFHCFGCGAHGDVIEFVSQLHQVSFLDACAILGGAADAPPVTLTPAPEAPDAPSLYRNLIAVRTPEDAIPKEGATLRAWNPKRDRWTYYHPSRVFVYRDAAGAPIGIVLRIELDEGRKLTPTLRYVALPGTGEIAWSHFPFDRPRPLYRLDKLTASPLSLPVLIVEGEKAADAAAALWDGPVVTWPGGGKSTAYVDWTPLAGRPLLLWGDADSEGERTMVGLDRENGRRWVGVGEHCNAAGAGPIRLIPWDHSRAKGWDAADAIAEHWTQAACDEWIEARAIDWTPPPPPPPRDDTPPDHAPPQADALTGDWPFRLLGFDNGVFFYLPNSLQQVIALSAAAHTPANLYTLAPSDWWRDHFPTKGGHNDFKVGDAISSLFERNAEIGIFESDRLRGRGAWIDAGRPTMHTGPLVTIGDTTTKPSKAPSRYIYEAKAPLAIKRAEPADNATAHRLVEITERITWENTLSASLLAGWIVTAPICGALKWRSHVWVTGPAGSGKTTVIDHIVAKVVGAIAIRRDGTTTEANLRQTLFHDARPVIFDEAESEDRAAALRIQAVVALARVASSGGSIGKGGKDGDPIDYVMRSCFCFSSINTAVSHYADESRISKLVLKKNDDPDAEAQYRQLMNDISDWFTEDFAASMFARTIENMTTLLANAQMFTNAAAAVLHNRRAADQIGTMIAGLYLCHNTNLITYEAAVTWIKSRNWNEHAILEGPRDEARLLTRLTTSIRRVPSDTGPRDVAIGELIEIAAKAQTFMGVTPDVANKELGRIGFKVHRPAGYPPYFTVANRSPAIEKILDGTPWQRDWVRPLRSLKDASPAPPTYFCPGMIERGTVLTVSLLGSEATAEQQYAA